VADLRFFPRLRGFDNTETYFISMCNLFKSLKPWLVVPRQSELLDTLADCPRRTRPASTTGAKAAHEKAAQRRQRPVAVT
jgi:hypothetical protein